ncbi:MAG: YifB family Mg chelatase-like AAA ATPase [Planctomycetota bacterium]
MRGQPGAVRAALLAAAGAHNLLLCGPPGSGKTMIAERLPALMPPLEGRSRIEVAKVRSVAGLGSPGAWSPPFRSPHHTVSAAGLLGGGPRAMPGEITLAHRGVLFLDEFPEFDRRALEGLREPLERGRVSVVRAGYRVVYPSRFLLVGAMNPCPCGRHGVKGRSCDCTPGQVARYAGRISGPLLDRFDLRVQVPTVRPTDLDGAGEPTECSAALRETVFKARHFQSMRGRLNGRLGLRGLEQHAPLDTSSRDLLSRAADRMGLSARGMVRVRRLARTIADVEEVEAVRREHLAEALSFRGG